VSFRGISVMLISFLMVALSLSAIVGALKNKIVHVRRGSYSRKRQPLPFVACVTLYFMLYFIATSMSIVGAFF
jgi:hypothetical protein